MSDNQDILRGREAEKHCTCLFSNLGGFDFVSSAAGPPSQVRKDFTLLSVHARMHVAPPFLGYDRGWRVWMKKKTPGYTADIMMDGELRGKKARKGNGTNTRAIPAQ